MGVNIELGVGSITRCDPTFENNHMIRAYQIAKRMGCKFTFGTDSHSVAELENRIILSDGTNLANAVVEEMQLTKNDIAEFVREGIEE